MSTDYRTFYDSDYLYAFNLEGREVVVVIDRVVAGTLTGSGGRKTRKPVVYFRGKEKGLALCKTNAKTIAAMLGNDTSSWPDHAITIYPTTTQFGSETVECIRIKPTPPIPSRDGKRRADPEQPAPLDREPGAEG